VRIRRTIARTTTTRRIGAKGTMMAICHHFGLCFCLCDVVPMGAKGCNNYGVYFAGRQGRTRCRDRQSGLRMTATSSARFSRSRTTTSASSSSPCALSGSSLRIGAPANPARQRSPGMPHSACGSGKTGTAARASALLWLLPRRLFGRGGFGVSGLRGT